MSFRYIQIYEYRCMLIYVQTDIQVFAGQELGMPDFSLNWILRMREIPVSGTIGSTTCDPTGRQSIGICNMSSGSKILRGHRQKHIFSLMNWVVLQKQHVLLVFSESCHGALTLCGLNLTGGKTPPPLSLEKLYGALGMWRKFPNCEAREDAHF